jgi:hypothetical protein
MATQPLHKLWFHNLKKKDINMITNKRPIWVWITTIITVIFGIMTIKSGGSVIFIDEARQAAGNYVDFVLWFNFTAGFFYVAVGIGVWFQKNWALSIAIILSVLTLLVFGAFGIHINSGGMYELHTVAAMCLRSVVWVVIAIKAYHILNLSDKMNKNTK